MTPRRFQLSRRKGWRKPANAVVVARPSRWGNRYVVGREIKHVDDTTVLVRDRAHAVQIFREWLDWQMTRFETMRPALVEALAGRDLCCWCPLDGPCHADVLLEVANR